MRPAFFVNSTIISGKTNEFRMKVLLLTCQCHPFCVSDLEQLRVAFNNNNNNNKTGFVLELMQLLVLLVKIAA